MQIGASLQGAGVGQWVGAARPRAGSSVEEVSLRAKAGLTVEEPEKG